MVTTFWSWHQLYSSITSWWAREASVRPLVWLSVSEMSCPNVQPALGGEISHRPWSSGSDHYRSHNGPSCGTSCKWLKALVWASESRNGEGPPWRLNICPSTNALTGRRSNRSVKYFHTLAFPYFHRRSSQKPYTWVTYRLSWFPLNMVMHSR